MRVADLAVFVVSAVDGVEVQTDARCGGSRPIWACPAWSSSTSSTGSGPSFERTLDELRAAFGAGVAPLELPIGEEASFCGVADLLTDTAFTYDLDRPAAPPRPHPRRHGGPRAPGARQPGGGHRGGRRRPPGAVPRRGTPSLEQLEHTLAHGVAAGHGVPGGVRLGHGPGGHRPPGRPGLRDRARAADRPPVEVEAGTSRVAPPTPTASRWPGCSRPSPTATWARSLC